MAAWQAPMSSDSRSQSPERSPSYAIGRWCCGRRASATITPRPSGAGRVASAVALRWAMAIAPRFRSRRLGGAAMAKRMLTWIFAIVMLAFVAPTSVFAHGEAGDEPFLKDLTTAFYDVKITPNVIHVGEPVTITGMVRVLDTWPYTLDPPQTAYITPVVPGPVFALKDRTVNDQSAPGSFFVERNGVYQFKMVILGREPGHWHVHPGIAIQGTGTLIGPGEWVDVQPSASKFAFPVSLLSGQVIDLDNYEGTFVWWWSFAGFVLGVIWMLYWTLTKRTVTNLAVTTQIGVNEEAADLGMITPPDH